LVTNELGLGGNTPGGNPADSSFAPAQSDMSINVGMAALILIAAFVIYKVIR
jgi:hypothetical protein